VATPLKRIDWLRAAGFQGLDEIELTFARPVNEQSGQWIVLLGDNGTGKSSLLRAFALTLGSGFNLLYEAVSRQGSLVRVEASEARIQCSYNDIMQACYIPHAIDGSSISRNVNGIFVVGYGALRGTALGGPRRAVEIDSFGVLGVRSLFLEDSPVIHAETWLRDLAFAGSKDPQAEVRFRAVLAVLTRVLPDVTTIEVEPDRTWVTSTTMGRIPLGALSDGYLTSAGWIIDMIARWVQYAATHDIPLGPDFISEMEGIALVDEIDLHLHPRWQVDIIRTLRETFPRMSFVVTTHNPLTIQGAQSGEVWVLRRELTPGGRIHAEQRDIPSGMRADQILTGEWFGLPSTLDLDTQDLLEQHREFLREGRPEGDPDRDKLEAELRSRLGRFNETSAEELARKIIAGAGEVSAEEIPELREKFQREFRSYLRKPRVSKAIAKPAKKPARKRAPARR